MTWSELKGDLYGDRPIQDGGEWLAIEAPYRAYDAALVPIDILALRPQSPDRFMRVKSFTVENNLTRPSIHPIKLDIATFMFNNNN